MEIMKIMEIMAAFYDFNNQLLDTSSIVEYVTSNDIYVLHN